MKKAALLLAALLCTTPYAVLSAPLWWSESMPHADGGDVRHSHGGPVEIRRGVYYKNLWLQSGDGPADSRYLDYMVSDKVLVLDVKGEVKEVPAGDVHGKFGVNFAMPDEGFYNVYVLRETQTDSGRQIAIAKSEALKHSCREGHDHVKPLMAPHHLDTLPLEIVRQRVKDENFHSLLSYGDTASFQVLRYGKPAVGAEVTLYTARGWRNTVRTDAEGVAAFMLIRDYYPPWHEFERRHRQDYMVSASYLDDGAAPAAGATRYVTTLNGSYYPSTRDYQSYAYGLLVGLFALTITGIAVYVYRRRRQRSFREVRFDEKN